MADLNPREDIEMDPIDDFDDIYDDENINQGDDANFDQETPFGDGELPVLDSEIRGEDNQIVKDDFYKHVKELGWEVDLDAALGYKVSF